MTLSEAETALAQQMSRVRGARGVVLAAEDLVIEEEVKAMELGELVRRLRAEAVAS